MHKSILDFKIEPNTVAGFHTHVLSDVPEDSDVFLVLTRKPPIAEMVAVSAKRMFIVNPDGHILLKK